jgi:hypothetical protein
MHAAGGFKRLRIIDFDWENFYCYFVKPLLWAKRGNLNNIAR